MAFNSMFERSYKLTFGQYDAKKGHLLPEFSTSQLRIKAQITVVADAKKEMASTIQIYNLGAESISTLEQASSLYIKVQAGYMYDGLSPTPTLPDELPVIFLGSVLQVNTVREGADYVTNITSSALYNLRTKAVCNRSFNRGASLEEVIQYLASTIPCGVRLAYENRGKIKLIEKKTFEGSTLPVLSNLCRKYNLRHFTEHNTLNVFDAEMKNHDVVKHVIPLSRIKGDVQTTINLRKVMQKGVAAATTIKFTTFLYSNLAMQDKIKVKLRDYSRNPSGDGQIPTKDVEVSITKLTYLLDSHDGNTWDTIIEGKGNQ